MADKRLNVLLVEDDDTHADQMRRLLVTAFDLRRASSLQEMRDVTRSGPDPHVVILDLRLPDGDDPLSTVRQVVAKFGRSAVIVSTGLDDEALAMKVLAMGAQDYLVKDVLIRDQMHTKIRFAYQRKRSELQRIRDSKTDIPVIRDFDENAIVDKIAKRLDDRYKTRSDVHPVVDPSKFTIGQIAAFAKKYWTFLAGSSGFLAAAYAAMVGANDLSETTAKAANSNADAIAVMSKQVGDNADDLARVEREAKKRSEDLRKAIVKTQVLQVKSTEHIERLIEAAPDGENAKKIKRPPELRKAADEVAKIEAEEKLFQ